MMSEEKVYYNYSQSKKLAFANNDAILLHSTGWEYSDKKEDTVAVWSLTDYKLRFTCPEAVLIGISRDGETFLTRQSTGEFSFKAWNINTGSEVPLQDVDPESCDFYQRTVVTSKINERSKVTLTIQDVLSVYPPHSFQLSRYKPDQGTFLDTWAITPNNKYIIVTVSGDTAGFDWADGLCVGITLGNDKVIDNKERYNYEVNRHQGDPLINFSEEHNLVAISGRGSTFSVYSLDQWRKLREIWVDGFGYIVSFSPKNKWFVAASVNGKGKSHSICLLDIEEATEIDYYKNRGKVERTIEETTRINGLLFHPNGQQIVSSLTNNTIHIWDVSTGELVATLS
jgi:WD40 repeat protein